MKKATLMGFSAAASLLLFSGCSDETIHTGNRTGTIFPLVDFDPTVVTSNSSRAGAEIEDISEEDLIITIISADGTIEEEYPYSEFPTDKEFPVGDYTMTVTYGSDEEEGFEKPSVTGSCDLTVNEDEASTPSVVATPSKAMVYIQYDDMLLGYMKTCEATLHSAGGAYIKYEETETRPAYIIPGETSVSVAFTKQNGKQGSLQVANFQTKAQHCYTLKLGLGADGYGLIDGITVKYDEMLEQEDVTIDISDEVLTTPAPEIKAKGFTPGEELTVVEGTVNANIRPKMVVVARGDIAHAVLTTQNCPSLIEKGWPTEIDITSASATELATLRSLGLRAPGLYGQTGIFGELDLTGVLPNVAPRNSSLPASEFTLLITDKAGRVSEPMTFTVKVEHLELEMKYNGVYNGQETLDIQVVYNGPDLANNVTFEYLNTRGIWTPTTIEKVTPSGDDIIVTLAIPDDAKGPLTIRATASNLQTELSIETAASLTVDPNDVFATSAIIGVQSDEYNPADKTINLFASTDGGQSFTRVSATQNGSELKVTGLKPATTYTFRAEIDGTNSRAVKTTTETAAQIPGSDMEGWEAKTKQASTNRWNYYDPVSPWFSNNDKAFSQTHATAIRSALSSVDYADSAHGGSTAGMVRTVGIGANYTTPFIGGTTKSTEYVAGELTLGQDNGGTQFTSRPSSVKFWTLYAPYNAGDQGLCEVTVLDASGSAIASGSLKVDAVSSYTQKSIPLSYSRGAGKAAKIKIRFRSSATDNFLNESGVNSLNNGDATGHFSGSYMYIDDVELAY